MKNICFPKNNCKTKVRSFKNYDVEEYQKDVASIDLLPIILRTDDINEIYKYYHDQLLNVINKHAPYIYLTKQEQNWNRKPWIGKRIQKLIKEKDKIYTKYLKQKSKFWYNRYRTLCRDSTKN